MLDKFLSDCPKGSRAANRRCLKWGDVRVDSIDKNFSDSKFLDANISLNCRVEKISIGIPRSPIDFCNRSFLAGHPRSIAVHLSQQFRMLSMQIFSMSLMLLRIRGQCFLPNGPGELRNLEVVNPKFCVHVQNMLRKS